MDRDDKHPSKQELAALELFHQLLNLSPDDGDRALLISLRLPNCQTVGEAWLSGQDVERLIDAALAIVEQRALYGDQEPAAAPLPIDGDDLTDKDVNDVFSGFATLLGSEDGEL